MHLAHIPRKRSERLIATGRAALAAFSLLAIWLDPSEPARYAHQTYTLLAGYLVYALLILAVVEASERFINRLGLGTHLVDVAVFTVLIALTEGPISPFFVWFVFALLAAALRWHWRGVLWTALALLAIYIGIGVYVELVLRDPAFELNRFIIRSAYLALAAALVGYLSAHERRLQQDLVQLASWPRALPQDSLVRELLPHAASILNARRLVLLWEEEEEPWRYEARLEDGAFSSARESAAPEPLLPAPLADADFLCADLLRARPVVLHTTGSGALARWRGTPLPDALARRLGARSVLALRLRGEAFSGRLFALDQPRLSIDDLVLGGIVARQMAADLEQFYTQQRLQQAAVAGERVRLAREIHDGVLQTLTGLGLQLQTAQRLLETDPDAARARLAELQDLVATEQSDLRFFVRQMKPVPLRDPEINAGLIQHLETLARRIERQWGLRVELSTGALARQLTEVMAHAVYRIAQEALVNAARHAEAQLARVRLELLGDRLRIVIVDDGQGFPFRGRYDLGALAAANLGPASIRQRVAALDGDLVLVSGEGGARLEIELPLRPRLQVLTNGGVLAPGSGPSASRRVG